MSDELRDAVVARATNDAARLALLGSLADLAIPGSPVEWLDQPTIDRYGRTTLGRWGGYLIDICAMIFNDRLVLTVESDPDSYEHGWCYPKGGAAHIAALAWNPETEAEPPGYAKRATLTARVVGERAR